MPELEILQAVSSGLRGALAILWATLLLRLWSGSRGAVDHSRERRDKAWQWQRLGLTLLGIAVVCFYCPEDVLRAEGLIGPSVSFAMGAGGSFVQALAMCCIISALDVLATGKSKGFPVYLGVTIMVPLSALLL